MKKSPRIVKREREREREEPFEWAQIRPRRGRNRTAPSTVAWPRSRLDPPTLQPLTTQIISSILKEMNEILIHIIEL